MVLVEECSRGGVFGVDRAYPPDGVLRQVSYSDSKQRYSRKYALVLEPSGYARGNTLMLPAMR